MTIVQKETILAKLQELSAFIEGIAAVTGERLPLSKEPSLFDGLLEPVETSEAPAEEVTAEANKVPRTRYTDGSANAQTIARHLSKELGRDVTRDQVVLAAKHIKGIKSRYAPSERNYRYDPESQEMIRAFIRKFNGI